MSGRKYQKSSHKRALYNAWIGCKCANPECTSGYNCEVHHILPAKNGGKNEYWNFVSLCRHCHRHLGLHSKHDEKDIILFTWKSYQELSLFGFVLDEHDPQYYQNLRSVVIRRVLQARNPILPESK